MAKRRKRKKKIKTLDVVLICVFGYMLFLNWQMIELFQQTGSAPETAWCALIAALIGECGICGWIRVSKDRNRERRWEKEDQKIIEKQGKEEEIL